MFFIEENTALVFSVAESGGQGLAPTPYFIRTDSTTADEDPGVYSDHSKIIPADTSNPEEVYFGSKEVGKEDLQKTTGNSGIVGVFLIIFAHEDTDDSGDYTGVDEPYSQNLPFQALRLVKP